MAVRIPLPGVVIPLALLLALGIIVWAGLRIVPTPFAPFSGAPGTVETIPLPSGLPAPVDRFYRVVYGDRIPVIHTVVMSGRAEIRPFGRPTLPARFRFTHIAGRSYRHYIEATFFGLPFMKVNESYVDGVSRFDTPAGREEGEPKTEQAANLGMWAELSGVPAVLLTDPRVRWEPQDADSAVLVVPADGGGEERFTVRFDPRSALVTLMEVMRYQRKDSAEKTLWVTRAIRWEKLSGFTATTLGTAWWYGADRPWAVFHTESIVVNPDLGTSLTAKGL